MTPLCTWRWMATLDPPCSSTRASRPAESSICATYAECMGALEELGARAASCTACGLASGRTHVVFGMGAADSRFLIVGEGPGAEEDRQGLPFVGRSGQLLDRVLREELGFSRAHDCYIANLVKCRPPANRDPEPEEIAACAGFLDGQLAAINPLVVVTLGNFATRTLLQTTEGITKLRGQVFPFRSGSLVPTYHPSAVLRSGTRLMGEFRADFVLAGQVRAGATA